MDRGVSRTSVLHAFAVTVATLTGCGGGSHTDGATDAGDVVLVTDGSDAARDVAGDNPVDVPAMDAADATDVTPPSDTLDTPIDRASDGVTVDAADTGAHDAISTDTGPADTGLADTGTVDTGCTGAAPTVTVFAPTSGQTLETCSRSGGNIYFDFTATTTGAVTQVTFNWSLGTLAVAPPFVITAGPPYVAHRCIGGVSSPTCVNPLNQVSGSTMGTWTVSVLATDSCGRTAMGTMPFHLTYTSVSHCPNP